MDTFLEPISGVGVVQIRTRRLDGGEWKNHRFVITPDHDLDADFPLAPGEAGPLPQDVRSRCEAFFADPDMVAAWENSRPPDEPIGSDELWATLRAERDHRISATDWVIIRHQCEVLRSAPHTLSGEQFAALLDYRQALRDLPENTADPAEPAWPDAPEFLT